MGVKKVLTDTGYMIARGAKKARGAMGRFFSGGKYAKKMNERSAKMTAEWEASPQGRKFEEKNKNNKLYQFLKSKK